MATEEGEGADPKVIAEGAELILVSSEGHEFQVTEAVAVASPTIKRLIKEGQGSRRIALSNIRSDILQKVIDFAESHADIHDDLCADDEENCKWAKELDSMNPACITCLVLAADFLEMDGLLRLACQRAAELMAGRTADEVEKMFHLKCQVTPAEEAEIKKNNKWAFE